MNLFIINKFFRMSAETNKYVATFKTFLFFCLYFSLKTVIVFFLAHFAFTIQYNA